MQSKGAGAGGSAHLVRGGDLDAEIAVAVAETSRRRAHAVGVPQMRHHDLRDLELLAGEGGGNGGGAQRGEPDSGCADRCRVCDRCRASTHLLPPLCVELSQLELARVLLDLDRLRAVDEDERADEEEGAEQEASRQLGRKG